jgi:hypothetical protein
MKERAGRWAAEFVPVVLGVLAAFAVVLRLIGDPDSAALSTTPPERSPVGVTTRGWQGLLSEACEAYPSGSFTAQQALLIATTEIGFGVSDGTYAEARDNGRLELIEDAELRWSRSPS